MPGCGKGDSSVRKSGSRVVLAALAVVALAVLDILSTEFGL